MNIDEREVVSLTQSLIKSSSVNPPAHTTECAGILLEYFQGNGIEAGLLEAGQGACNIMARLLGQGRGKTLVLNGHLDVVPPGEGWSVDPFGAQIKDGMLYGRGSSDMKSGLAAMAAALVGLKRSGKAFDGEIIYQGVCDEETGSRQGTVYLMEKGIGKNADFAIVAEPTDLQIQLGNRGLRWIDVEVKGRACHAGRPHLGVNAIAVAAQLIGLIQSHAFTLRDDLFEVPTPSMSVTRIEGGSKINVIPNQCRFGIDRRMLPGETTETVTAEIERMIQDVAQKNPGAEIKQHVRPTYWDPYVITRQEPVVLALETAVEQITGRQAVFGVKGSCTDGSHLFHMGGVPAVLFGPGHYEMAHKADECVAVEKIVDAAGVLMAAMEKLLGRQDA